MNWIKNFDLFLFDFDGLLVNTEHIHFQAYINMCARRGVKLNWSFLEYCAIAHTNNKAIRQALEAQYPQLFEEGNSWNVLYEEKKTQYLQLLSGGRVELMEGVEKLLPILKKENKQRCVVTNSTKEQVDMIRSSLSLLNTIENWITKDQYTNPKPDPECYLQAIKRFGKGVKKMIGFEDSLRGLKALLETPATCVLICPEEHPHVQTITSMSGVFYYPSFNSIQDKDFG